MFCFLGWPYLRIGSEGRLVHTRSINLLNLTSELKTNSESRVSGPKKQNIKLKWPNQLNV